jgi:hypothetical protein
MMINIFLIVLSAFAQASWWVDLIGAHTAAIVTGVMLTCATALNGVLHALSSPTPGPAVAPPAPPKPLP